MVVAIYLRRQSHFRGNIVYPPKVKLALLWGRL